MKTFCNARGALDTDEKEEWTQSSLIILSKKRQDAADLLQKWILSVVSCNVWVNLQPIFDSDKLLITAL